MVVYEKAHAKVNLTLRVLGKRADGYHRLESLVAFVQLADEIEIEFNKKAELIVEGAFAEYVPLDESNLIFRALSFLGVEARVKLKKHIPVACGLGGGSADCAAVIRGIARGLRIHVPRGLFELGADVPACYLSQSLWLNEAGERVESLPLPRLHCVLAAHKEPIGTQSIFDAWDRRYADDVKESGAYPLLRTAAEVFAFCSQAGNDLTPFVPQAQGLLSRLAELIKDSGAYGMSGSGGACFAIVESAAQAQQVAHRLQEKEKDIWVWQGACLNV